jgi:hypothetical protein
MAPAKNQTRKKSRSVGDDPPELGKLLRALRSYLREAVPETKEAVNSWGVPTFVARHPFCFYLAGKNHVTFGFHYGTSLADPLNLLEGTGRNLRHVKLRTLDDLQQPGLRALVLAASRFEPVKPMPGMSGKKPVARKKRSGAN